MALSRRQLLGLGGIAAGGLLVPTRGVATSASQRRFVFVFCPGGWDPAMVFAPVFSSAIERGGDDTRAETGALAYTDAPTRPSVRNFFRIFGDRTCLVNGWRVPSVAHDVCTRLTMTGSFNGDQDDWISIVAAGAGPDVPLPNLHVDGPLYPHAYPTASVRTGSDGQLAALLDGEALRRSDVLVQGPSAAAQAASDAVLRARTARFGGAGGQSASIAAASALALDRLDVIRPYADVFAPEGTSPLLAGVNTVVDALGLGLARTATLAYGTGGNGAWDTHALNDSQDVLFETLFSALLTLCDGLASTSAPTGGALLDETTVVVLSEMGRTPARNSAGGKDHWPYTSAMFVGAGVRPGVVGSYDDRLAGAAVDLEDGTARDDGTVLGPGNIGATILALADVDPGPWVEGGEAAIIRAMLS
jgi:hypothetical protein